MSTERVFKTEVIPFVFNMYEHDFNHTLRIHFYLESLSNQHIYELSSSNWNMLIHDITHAIAEASHVHPYSIRFFRGNHSYLYSAIYGNHISLPEDFSVSEWILEISDVTREKLESFRERIIAEHANTGEWTSTVFTTKYGFGEDETWGKAIWMNTEETVQSHEQVTTTSNVVPQHINIYCDWATRLREVYSREQTIYATEKYREEVFRPSYNSVLKNNSSPKISQWEYRSPVTSTDIFDVNDRQYVVVDRVENNTIYLKEVNTEDMNHVEATTLFQSSHRVFTADGRMWGELINISDDQLEVVGGSLVDMDEDTRLYIMLDLPRYVVVGKTELPNIQGIEDVIKEYMFPEQSHTVVYTTTSEDTASCVVYWVNMYNTNVNVDMENQTDIEDYLQNLSLPVDFMSVTDTATFPKFNEALAYFVEQELGDVSTTILHAWLQTNKTQTTTTRWEDILTIILSSTTYATQASNATMISTPFVNYGLEYMQNVTVTHLMKKQSYSYRYSVDTLGNVVNNLNISEILQIMDKWGYFVASSFNPGHERHAREKEQDNYSPRLTTEDLAHTDNDDATLQSIVEQHNSKHDNYRPLIDGDEIVIPIAVTVITGYSDEISAMANGDMFQSRKCLFSIHLRFIQRYGAPTFLI